MPKMGDIIEVALDGEKNVIRFFPKDGAAQATPVSVQPESHSAPEQNLALVRPAYSEKEAHILGRTYTIRLRHGYVLSADARTEQSISTTYRRAGDGWVPDIRSHEYTTSDIRLLQQGGKKADFTLGQKYKVHTGDEVTLFSISRNGADNGWWMGIQNHTTERWQAEGSLWNFDGTTENNRDLGFFSPNLYLLILGAYLVAAFLIGLVVTSNSSGTFGTWFAIFAVCGVVGVVHWLTAAIWGLKKAQKAVRAEIQKVLSDFS